MKTVQVRVHSGQQPQHYAIKNWQPNVGDWCIVQWHDNDFECGQCVTLPENTPPEVNESGVPCLIRQANEEEIQRALKRPQQEQESWHAIRQVIQESGLPMDLVSVEFGFSSNKVRIYYVAEERIDFRDLVRNLGQVLHHRIEMRQIGVRNRAGLVGGFGHCGQQLCCSRFLREFKPVAIRMAKAQGLALNPTKISGQCGRLMCCLRYEYMQYVEDSKPGSRRNTNKDPDQDEETD